MKVLIDVFVYCHVIYTMFIVVFEIRPASNHINLLYTMQTAIDSFFVYPAAVYDNTT